VDINIDKLTIAFNEFLHVGGALVIVIALVSILTGFMREYIPQDKLQKKLTKNEKYGPMFGSFLGMLTPFCSASVVPVTMGMASMGVSLGTVMSFLISAPLCNFVVLAMIYATFGLKVTAVYLLITLAAAIFGGWAISKTPWRNEIKRGEELEDKKAPSCSASPKTDACSEQPTKVQASFRFALALFKKIVPYVLLGALISGVSAAYLPTELVEEYVGGDNMLSIVIAAVIGVPLYLRIEMAIPLLSILITKGMSLGPAMALIVGGTGASLPEIALVSAVLKPKAVLAFVSIILITAIIAGSVFQYIL
jgi:uncharacterized membrane protein YraQ (UPF0718 family)